MDGNTESLALPAATSRDTLTDIICDGAHRLLAQAIDAEVATCEYSGQALIYSPSPPLNW